MTKPRKLIKLELTVDQNCWKKENHDHCCCNCRYRHVVMGHPWVTNTSIMTPTGLFVCTYLACEDNSDAYVASSAHGACEGWEEKA